MKNDKAEIKIGKDIYSEMRKNHRTVWGVVIVSTISVLSMLYVSLAIYSDSTNKIFTINNSGDLIPLSLVSSRTDKVKVLKSNADYFVKNFYDLDQYSIKEKKEKALWLVGEQPTKIIKDKDNKGYYNDFLSINGLVQKAEILPDSWNISNIDDSPNLDFSVLVKRVNGRNEEFYRADVQMRMTKVNINYPYNPFGYLITNFVENLVKVDPPTEQQIQIQDSIRREHINPTIR
ncbi:MULTISPECIES: hypothetical protein [Chryseobacterium group]|uniref:hypothetical protein n=1 Tax=Chryseobacterium group TaxID=2782232 RepID=UPI0012A8E18D|nr:MULTISPECIES: hypothetical protein [Chryseobacterium group]MDF0720864.1 hypothetical protein [Kaistella sp. PBT33-4]QFG54475.1 hypothetical protein F7R58_12735 [Chryseobacterium sp.]